MRSFSGSLAATAAISFAGIVSGSALRYCPGNGDGVCYSVGVPTSSAESGSGNIYFQIEAPTSYRWVALGPGSSMSNSYMFIMYQDGKGNVTISPRKGTFHTAPQLDTSGSAAKLTLLGGSGVSADGKTMAANVRCSNCESLSGGGKVTPTDTSSDWIAAWRSGSSLSSTSASQQIDQHDDTVRFQLDLTRGTVSADSNPFWQDESDAGNGNNGGGNGGGNSGGNGGGNSGGSGGNTGGGGGAGDGGSGSGSGSGSDTGGGSDSGDGGDSSGGGVTIISDKTPDVTIMLAHGIIMAVVMIGLYPIGSLMMPLLGKWLAHAAFQMVAFVLMWVGFGLGLKAAMERNILYKQPHTILGTVVVCGLLLQPALGLLHHRYYVRGQTRPAFRYGHIWYGRLLIALGIVNGALGLNLSLASNNFRIGYSVAAAGMVVVYLLVKVLKGFSERTSRKQAQGEI